MNDWWVELFDFAEEYLDCPYCQQKAGYCCITKTGNVASYMHAARTDALRELCATAYGEGMRDGEDMAERKQQFVHGYIT